MKSLFVFLIVILSAALPVNARGTLIKHDSLNICLALEPPSLDPTRQISQPIAEATHLNIFEGLVALNEEGRIVPRLAKSWTLDPHGTAYVFTLREGVFFHDGRPFTAKDVKYAFDRALASDSLNPRKQLFKDIQEIQILDDYVVLIRLKQPVSNFLFHLTFASAVILSPASVEDAASRPIGTGPYVFVNWRRGSELVYRRYEKWWGGKPPIRNVKYTFLSDPQAQLAALLTGRCDLFSNFSNVESLPYLRKKTNFKIEVGQTEGEIILVMNHARKPFSDPRVREAITRAIDRKIIAKVVYPDVDVALIGSHFSPQDPFYTDLIDAVPYDLPKAKSLLAEAGYPNGFSVTLRFPIIRYAQKIAEIIAATLLEVGVTLKLEPMDFSHWLERVFMAKDYALSVVAHTEPRDLGFYARPSNYFNYKNPAFVALIEKIKTTHDPQRLEALYAKAQRILSDDYVNVFLFMLPKITVSKPNLEGAWKNWPLPITPLAQLRWLSSKKIRDK